MSSESSTDSTSRLKATIEAKDALIEQLLKSLEDAGVKRTKTPPETELPPKRLKELKPNSTPEEFIAYAEAASEFPTKPTVKNPLRLYIETNTDAILKYVVDSIDHLTPRQLCPALLLVAQSLSYARRQIVFHDIALHSTDKLAFAAAALFTTFETDPLSQVIAKIAYRQLCIDADNADLGDAPAVLDLAPPDVSLWDHLPLFLVPGVLFGGDMRVAPDAVQCGFALRLLCHYVDWDYTYNEFIVPQLHPYVLAEKCALHVYYLGILMMNARRLFGRDESVLAIERELLEILEWPGECALAAYLILKQTRNVGAWMEAREDALRAEGYNMEYLRTCRLI